MTAPVRWVHRRSDDAREATGYAQTRDEASLDEAEKELRVPCRAKGSRLLDLGCGAGQDAFGAVRRSYGVVARHPFPLPPKGPLGTIAAAGADFWNAPAKVS